MASLLLVAGAFAQTQTQNGVVKTRGRMVGGKLVPGSLLDGTTVQVEGRQAILAKDGNFSFPVSSGQYTLKSVTKQGYKLLDAEMCHQYNYSANPLAIVMEQPEQLMRDKLAAERKIRRQLQDQLREKEDRIEAMREQNAITQEQYNTALQELYSTQESNEKLISNMAKRYSELDYDQLDEFQRQVSYYIENGELAKADSLLRSRGDVAEQVNASLKSGAALQQKRQQLEKAGTVLAEETLEVAQRCYSYYELFVAKFNNDSAAYYLALRTSLDTTNIEWLCETGDFYMDFLADYDKAMSYYKIALRQSHKQNGDITGASLDAYNGIGLVFFEKADYDKAMEYLQKAKQDLFLPI